MKKNTKGFSEFIVLLTIFTLIGVAGFFVYQNYQTRQNLNVLVSDTRPEQTKQASSTPTPNLTPTETAPSVPINTSKWEVLKSKNLSLKYPSEELIGCNRSDMSFEFLEVRTIERCNSSGAPENSFSIVETNPNDDRIYNHLKELSVGETAQGITPGEIMAKVTYIRLDDSKVGGYESKNYQYSSNSSKNRSQIFSFISGPSGKMYTVNQSYITTYPNDYNIDFTKVFPAIFSTLQFKN